MSEYMATSLRAAWTKILYAFGACKSSHLLSRALDWETSTYLGRDESR
jgi:hypothetical protein